jgi:hypothetical protein
MARSLYRVEAGEDFFWNFGCQRSSGSSVRRTPNMMQKLVSAFVISAVLIAPVFLFH